MAVEGHTGTSGADGRNVATQHQEVQDDMHEQDEEKKELNRARAVVSKEQQSQDLINRVKGVLQQVKNETPRDPKKERELTDLLATVTANVEREKKQEKENWDLLRSETEEKRSEVREALIKDDPKLA